MLSQRLHDAEAKHLTAQFPEEIGKYLKGSKDEDPQHPLTQDGLDEVRKVGIFVTRKEKYHPDSVYHSGKTRAKETAQAFAELMSPGRDVCGGK